MIFMGQEFLEDKRWADDPVNHPGTLIYWDGLATDKTMIDFHRFTRELLWLGRQQPALSGESVATVLMDNVARVLVVHRWIEGVGRDLIVVFSLNESTMSGYRVPFPREARGSRYSIATSTTIGSIPWWRAMAGVSRRTDQD
jgi:1,4-alpha-glucan branching enzyme